MKRALRIWERRKEDQKKSRASKCNTTPRTKYETCFVGGKGAKFKDLQQEKAKKRT